MRGFLESDFILGLGHQGKEFRESAGNVGDDGVRNAVVHNVQEADLGDGTAEVAEKRRPHRGIVGESQVERGNGGCHDSKG